MKKVLAISCSLRDKSNSEILLDSFIQGAESVGNEVEKISLKGKTINFCKGCLVCGKLGKCVIDDDAIEIAEKMKNSDVLVFASPIYYYEMCGQLKTLIDRVNSLYYSNYSFREVYLLTTATEDEVGVDQRAVNGIKGFVECYEKSKFVKSLFVGGVTKQGEITGNKKLLQAFELGKSV